MRRHVSADCDFTNVRREIQKSSDQDMDHADADAKESICLFPTMKKCIATAADKMLVDCRQCKN